MPTSPCPSLKTLEGLRAGTLDEALAEAARAHLLGCAACAAAFDQPNGSHRLRDGAQPAHTPAPPEGAARRHVLPTLRPHPAEAGAGEPPGITKATAAAPEEEKLPPLGPPRAAGELGTLGAYRVQEVLGRGGMGVVFRAYDETLERTVAVKVLRPSLDSDSARSRLVREARLAAQLKHDHLVTIHAVMDPPDGLPYLVMEYLAGPTLAALIRARHRLAPAEAAELLGQAAEGLAAAHAQGLVHRDIKPANLMLDAATGRAKVLDFGLARLAEQASGLTLEGSLTGTPSYMSPEQIQAPATADARADVYALGVTLYEALTGEVPFRGTVPMVLRQVLEDEPRPPRRVNDAVPRDLETVCLKAMAKEPQRRYPTAREFADDLARFRRGEPIQARPAGPVERLGRWCRRNPRVALLSGLVFALLLLTAVGSAVAAVHIAGAKAQADREKAEADEARRAAVASAAAARAAQKQADASAAAAGAHLRLAMATLDTLVGKVQQQLGAHSGTLQLRQELLQTALHGLAQIADSAEKHPAADRTLVTVHERLGHLFFLLGQREKAREQFEHERRLAETLLAATPEDVSLQLAVAMAHDHLGNIALYAGDNKGADAHYLQALRRREKLVKVRPDDEAVVRDLAGSHARLGDVRARTNDVAGAQKLYEQAQQLLLAQAWSRFFKTPVLNDIRYNYIRMGHADSLLGDYPAALSHYHKALEYAEAFVAADPTSVEGKRQLAITHFCLGEHELALGRVAAAEKDLRRGVAIAEPLTAANHDNAELPPDLAQGYVLLGQALRHTADPAGAVPWYEKAAAVREKIARGRPGDILPLRNFIEVCRELAAVEAERGGYAQAVAQTEQALTACRRSVAAGPTVKAQVKTLKRALEADLTVYRVAQEGGLASEEAILKRKAPAAARLLALRARDLARRGRHDEATAAIERLRGLSPKSARRLLEVGCLYAWCAGVAGKDRERLPPESAKARQDYVERAVTALGQAARMDRGIARRLGTNPALALLHAEPSFQKLLQELRAGDAGQDAVSRPASGGR